MLFGITVSSLHRLLHKILRFLHAFLVPKYVQWHSMNHWRSLIGTFPDWPTAVAIIDCTPFRINKPKGKVFILSFQISSSMTTLNIVGKLIYSLHINIVFLFRSYAKAFLSSGSSLLFFELVGCDRC